MSKDQTLPQKLKLSASKKTLMLIAGVVWSIPSSILVSKGIRWLLDFSSIFVIGIIISTIFGLMFYFFLFNKIASKHILRIRNLENERPSAFAFFNVKGYAMMGGMILLGILLRSTAIIPVKYLSMLYITMGIPLSISTFRFFYNWIKYA